MNRAGAWVALLAVLACCDGLTAVLAPGDAWNPLHPHPKPWTYQKGVPHVQMHVVCWIHPAVGPATGCFHELGKGTR